MAFIDFIKSGGKLDYLFLPSGAWDTAKEVSTHQEALVQDQYSRGVITQEKQAELLQEIGGTTTFDAYFSDPENSPTKAFTDSLAENVSKLPQTINKTVGGLLSGVLRSVPANLWVIAAIALLIYVIIQLRLLQRFAFKG